MLFPLNAASRETAPVVAHLYGALRWARARLLITTAERANSPIPWLLGWRAARLRRAAP